MPAASAESAIRPASAWRGPLPLALLALVASVVCFAPHLWLMRDPVPGSFEWDRALTFLRQCEEPLRRDIEPAMLWRLLPPYVAHVLQLHGRTPLLLPWAGLVAATFYAAVLLHRRCPAPAFVFGGTLLFATTSAVLVPVGWLGMNDGWVWLALLVVAFGRHPAALAAACLLAPWVDERFIIGYPLAWLVARVDRGESASLRTLLPALWLAPYAAARLWFGQHDEVAAAATRAFLTKQFRETLSLLPFVPLGWWMGLRVAWVPVGYAIWAAGRDRGLLLLAVVFVTLAVSALLASDFSRSAAIASPLVLTGCFAASRLRPDRAPRLVLACGLLNLAIPAAHVTYQSVALIQPLPLELYRLWR